MDDPNNKDSENRSVQISKERVVTLPVLIHELLKLNFSSNPNDFAGFLIRNLDDIKNGLEKLERLEQSVNNVWAKGEWGHAYDCGELGKNTSTRACTCGLNNFKRIMFWNGE